MASRIHIEYLQEENRVLREQLGEKRLLFTDVQRRRIAAKTRKIGRKGLSEIGTLVTPDTLLRWYRRLIAKKYDSSRARRAGRPKTAAEFERLILRMVRELTRRRLIHKIVLVVIDLETRRVEIAGIELLLSEGRVDVG